METMARKRNPNVQLEMERQKRIAQEQANLEIWGTKEGFPLRWFLVILCVVVVAILIINAIHSLHDPTGFIFLR